jgi:hypothetical protein
MKITPQGWNGSIFTQIPLKTIAKVVGEVGECLLHSSHLEFTSV